MTKSQSPVAILLSTYNGEKFLRAQLDSIIQQTAQEWTLYVRDDGSTDKTADIIKSYVSNHPKKIVLLDEPDGNLGFAPSFMILLSAVEADYYMYCDQDDIWLPDKVALFLAAIRHSEARHPNNALCIFSDIKVVDATLQPISDSLWSYAKVNPDNSKNMYKMIVYGWPAYGCAMIFNHCARQYLLPYPNPGWKYHDLWTVAIISRVGFVDYLPIPTILYRQHTSNVSGAHRGITREHYIRAIRNLPRTIVDQRQKLLAFKQLPFHISILKIVRMKAWKCLKNLLT